MKVFILLMTSVFLFGCGIPLGSTGILLLGPKGEDGQSIVGAKGDTGAPGQSIVGPKGDTGDKGDDGVAGNDGAKGDTGETGPKGEDGEIATVVQLCPGTSNYGVFVETALCINNKLYGVYSIHGGFLTYLAPGNYSSNGVGSACNFSVLPDCIVEVL